MRSSCAPSTRSSLPLAALLVATLAATACDSGTDPGNGNGNGNGGPDPTEVVGTISHMGAGVGSVSIMLQDGPSADRMTTTSTTGIYEFDDVAPGTWELAIAPPSYFEMGAGQMAARSITVTEEQTTTVDATLSPTDADPQQEIDLLALSFDSDDITVAPGTEVRFNNATNTPHTITPSGHSEWSGTSVSSTGETLDVVMNDPGTYNYLCTIHAGMDGVIRVEVP